MFFLYRVRCIHPDDERGPYSAANYHLRRYKAFSYNERILERRDTAWMKLVRTHKLFDSSVFAADFRLLRDQSGQYLLDHTSGRCDHFTCSEIPIMQALMSSKSCLIVAESRGTSQFLRCRCVCSLGRCDRVSVSAHSQTRTKRFGVSEQYGNRYIPLM